MQVIYTKIINIELLTFSQAVLKECWNYVNNNVNNFFLKKILRFQKKSLPLSSQKQKNLHSDLMAR